MFKNAIQLCTTSSRNAVFLLGVLGIIWCVMWLLLVSDTPAQHPRITAYERKYIETTIGGGEHHLPVNKMLLQDLTKIYNYDLDMFQTTPVVVFLM